MANKIYSAPETAITFGSNSNTVTFTPKNVANGAGRVSAQWDRGSGSKPDRYKWRVLTKAGAALAVGVLLEIYLATSDGTYVDGNFGTADAAWSAIGKKNNVSLIGLIVADSTTNGEVQIASGVVYIYDRYVSVAWWNALGQSLTNVDADHLFELIPVPPEVQ